MAWYGLILRQDGAIWLRITLKPLLIPNKFMKGPKMTQNCFEEVQRFNSNRQTLGAALTSAPFILKSIRPHPRLPAHRCASICEVHTPFCQRWGAPTGVRIQPIFAASPSLPCDDFEKDNILSAMSVSALPLSNSRSVAVAYV